MMDYKKESVNTSVDKYKWLLNNNNNDHQALRLQ